MKKFPATIFLFFLFGSGIGIADDKKIIFNKNSNNSSSFLSSDSKNPFDIKYSKYLNVIYRKSERDYFVSTSNNSKNYLMLKNRSGKDSGLYFSMACHIKKPIEMTDRISIFLFFERVSKLKNYSHCEEIELNNDLSALENSVLKSSTEFIPKKENSDHESIQTYLTLEDLDELLKIRNFQISFCDENFVFDDRHFGVLHSFRNAIYRILQKELKENHRILIKTKDHPYPSDYFIWDEKEHPLKTSEELLAPSP